MSFSFSGTLEASKSLFNRWLIIDSFANDIDFKISGRASCEDYLALKEGLEALELKKVGKVNTLKVIDCKDAATALRFLVLRASREAGRYKFVGSERLMSRPHGELHSILLQLGVKSQFDAKNGGSLVVDSQGWKIPLAPVIVSGSHSSQFATALLLSAWKLPQILTVQLDWSEGVSRSYLDMTFKTLERAGLQMKRVGEDLLRVGPHQRVRAGTFEVEPDMSSTFAVCAAAMLSGGKCEIVDFPVNSVQPDYLFVEILKAMGGKLSIQRNRALRKTLLVEAPKKLNPVEVDLKNTPDLFPILSVLCALAPGYSKLFGAPHLRFKESDRQQKMHELLTAMGRKADYIPGGLGIKGFTDISGNLIKFDPDHDHRLAMAAGIAVRAGFDIKILHPEVVNKSFPDFWKILG